MLSCKYQINDNIDNRNIVHFMIGHINIFAIIFHQYFFSHLDVCVADRIKLK